MLKLVPHNTSVQFIQKRWFAFILSLILIIASIGILFERGLNLGIDFTGGIVMEMRFEGASDIAQLRQLLTGTVPYEISLQHFGSDNDIMLRIGQDPNNNGKQMQAVQHIKDILNQAYPGQVDYRKVDFVGPQVGSELIQSGAIALFSAFAAILLYIWFRFEWQFGVGAIVALIHDVILTLGFFSLLGLEFNLTSIAAILTIIGYSINDSVVIYDRVRENLRKYKKMLLEDLLNNSINNTLSRTLLTAGTTIVALLALVLFGGHVIESFSKAVLFGVIIGTYSSIYVAAPVLIYLGLRPDTPTAAAKE